MSHAKSIDGPGKGSFLAMPMLILNMGGEMVYILEQRLQAQNIAFEKSRKVLTDVVRTMFDASFIKELFTPQTVYSLRSTRQVFDRLAHSSIMRLNKTSMDKLFDLMSMGCKHQVLSTTHPQQMLDVTFNHLEALKSIVEVHSVNKSIDEAYEMFVKIYSSLSCGEWWRLKHTLATYFQDRRVKVSLFLQDGLQNLDGTFYLSLARDGPVTHHGTPPGKVFYYSEDGSLANVETVAGASAPNAQAPLSICKNGLIGEFKATTTLGANMYGSKNSRRNTGRKPFLGPNSRSAIAANFVGTSQSRHTETEAETHVANQSHSNTEQPVSDVGYSAAAGPGAARAGLSLLASMVGNTDYSESKTESFKLDLFGASSNFTGDDDSLDASMKSLVIDVQTDDTNSLHNLAETLTADHHIDSNSKHDDDDLLDLMDEASNM